MKVITTSTSAGLITTSNSAGENNTSFSRENGTGGSGVNFCAGSSNSISNSNDNCEIRGNNSSGAAASGAAALGDGKFFEQSYCTNNNTTSGNSSSSPSAQQRHGGGQSTEKEFASKARLREDARRVGLVCPPPGLSTPCDSPVPPAKGELVLRSINEGTSSSNNIIDNTSNNTQTQRTQLVQQRQNSINSNSIQGPKSPESAVINPQNLQEMNRQNRDNAINRERQARNVLPEANIANNKGSRINSQNSGTTSTIINSKKNTGHRASQIIQKGGGGAGTSSQVGSVVNSVLSQVSRVSSSHAALSPDTPRDTSAQSSLVGPNNTKSSSSGQFGAYFQSGRPGKWVEAIGTQYMSTVLIAIIY